MKDGNGLVIADKINENGAEYKLVCQEFAPEKNKIIMENSPLSLTIGEKAYNGYIIDELEYKSILFAIDKSDYDIFIVTSNKVSDIYREWFKYIHGIEYEFNNQIIWINKRYNENQVQYFWDLTTDHFMDEEK